MFGWGQKCRTPDQELGARFNAPMFFLFAFGIGGQDGSLGERRLNSGILGASVANLSIAGLQENVEIVLRNMEPVPVSLSTK